MMSRHASTIKTRGYLVAFRRRDLLRVLCEVVVSKGLPGASALMLKS